MYDKVKLWIARNSTTPDVCKYLEKANEITDLQTGEIRTYGSIDGLKVSVYVGGISIIGSLSKYLYSNNIYPLNRYSTAEAITKLSDSLHIDLSEARVTGVEFGTQFVMCHKVEDYLLRLGDIPRLQRYHFDAGTLYYKTKGRQQPKVFAFYDKQKDAEAKNMILPNGLKEANLLKYEIRLNGRLPQQLNVPEVKASTLSERKFYMLMVKRYQESYYSISKSKQIKTNIMNDIKTVSDAFDVFVARLISQSDNNQIAGFLDELKTMQVFDDRKSYTRLKKKIQEVSTKADITVSDELIRELDNEIKNIGSYV